MKCPFIKHIPTEFLIVNNPVFLLGYLNQNKEKNFINQELFENIKMFFILRKEKQMKLKTTKIILLLTFIFILFGVGIAFGKYISEQTIGINSTIAKPILEIERGECININDNNTNAEYKFSVKNYNNADKITDTDINYTIEIIASGDSAINYSLYKDNKKIQMNKNKTSKILIKQGKKQKHNYILKIDYDKSKSKELTDLMEDIGIRVYSEQTL